MQKLVAKASRARDDFEPLLSRLHPLGESITGIVTDSHERWQNLATPALYALRLLPCDNRLQVHVPGSGDHRHWPCIFSHPPTPHHRSCEEGFVQHEMFASQIFTVANKNRDLTPRSRSTPRSHSILVILLGQNPGTETNWRMDWNVWGALALAGQRGILIGDRGDLRCLVQSSPRRTGSKLGTRTDPAALGPDRAAGVDLCSYTLRRRDMSRIIASTSHSTTARVQNSTCLARCTGQFSSRSGTSNTFGCSRSSGTH